MTDGIHYDGYQEMLSKGDWGQMAWWTASRAIRVAKLHGPLRLRSQRHSQRITVRRQLEEFQHNFGAEPAVSDGSGLIKRAFNGVTIGKGHLAEAKAAIQLAPR